LARYQKARDEAMTLNEQWMGYATMTIAIALAVGCNNQPRNRSQVPKSTTFSGFLNSAGHSIEAYAQTDNGGLSLIGSGTVGTSPVHRDCNQVDWYNYSFNVNFPSEYKWYGPSALANRNVLKVKVRDRTSNVDLITFESDATTESCLDEHCAGGDKATLCKSRQSPILTLDIACGEHDFVCCKFSFATSADKCLLSTDLCSDQGLCRTSNWLAASDYAAIADFPAEIGAFQTNQMQGIDANPEMNALVLTQSRHATEPVVSAITRLWVRPLNMSASQWEADWPPPYVPSFAGCEHVGDPDVLADRIFVPLEECPDGKGKIAVYTMTLSLIGMVSTKTDKAPWVSIDPRTASANPSSGLYAGRLYTSAFDNVRCIEEYKFGINGSSFALTFQGCRNITDGTNAVTMQRIQGGDFSPNGKLYLVSDSLLSTSNLPEKSGFHGIQISPGSARWMFRREIAVDRSQGQELEGIMVFPWAGHGDVHVGLLEPEDLSSDDIYIKHYDVSDNSRL
jgi:hypothetical protein